MAKRQRAVSLSFVLLRFAIIMSGCMLLCCLVWFTALIRLQNSGFAYRKAVPYQQAEKMLEEKPENFVAPGDDFLPAYALFEQGGEVLESNVKGTELERLIQCFRENTDSGDVLRHTYTDGSTIIILWHYRSEFTDPVLRNMLPPFEYLWLSTLIISLLLSLLLNTMWLRICLASRLKLFREVSEKIGARELDFEIPRAGIREYDQALDAMAHMRDALYNSLSSQWAEQQKREAEIAALAHDLKTPLTLIGGNAELLLGEELPARSRRKVETIMSGNDRARQYVASLLETAAGTDETFEIISLPSMFDQLCQAIKAIAETRGVILQTHNSLEGTGSVQRDRLLRAFSNVVQNAVEHTPPGGNVYLEGSMVDGGWQVVVRDEGPGFSRTALHHAAERLWRGDTARGSDGHNGLGLWFAAEVIKNHAGQLKLCNCDSGAMVTIKFCKTVRE